MEQQIVAMQDETQNAANPFGVQLDGPLHNQAAAGKHAPKTIDSTDIGTFGGRGGG